MKKIFKYFFYSLLSLVGIAVVVLVIFASLLFFNPTLLINPKSIDYVLTKTNVLKSWSWKSGVVNHRWEKWNNREFEGVFKDLCIEYQKSNILVNTCMEEVSWNINLKWTYKDGFNYLASRPLSVLSKSTKVYISKNNAPEGLTPDYLSMWNAVWNNKIPPHVLKFDSIEIFNEFNKLVFNFSLLKNENNLVIKSDKFNLLSTRKDITITAPKKIKLPVDIKTKKPLTLDDLKLNAKIEDRFINVIVTTHIAKSLMNIHAEIPKELLSQHMDQTLLIKKILLTTSGIVEFQKLNKTIKKLFKYPYNTLPAPFNSMEGDLKIELKMEDPGNLKDIVADIVLKLNVSGAGQVIDLDLASKIPYDLKSNRIGLVEVGVDLKKMVIRLPKLSRTRLPPQLRPDPRFKVSESSIPKKKKNKIISGLKVNIDADGEKSLVINTNLLDEPLVLSFNLDIAEKSVQNGYVKVKPLHTKVFKRPIFIKDLKVLFDFPLEPQIVSTIEFNLPNYLVTLKLEGPLSKPRQVFASNPPLPQDDIIAVILFGKPLDNLTADDKNASQDVSEIISQGVLSLAVLYYLAGSPVESIGYNPDTKTVSAQFGLSKRNALYLKGKATKGTLNSYGIRHSLGKGWYIDSSVQRNNDLGTTRAGNDYGVLLERVKAY